MNRWRRQAAQGAAWRGVVVGCSGWRRSDGPPPRSSACVRGSVVAAACWRLVADGGGHWVSLRRGVVGGVAQRGVDAWRWRVSRWQARKLARPEGHGGARAGVSPSTCSSHRLCCSAGAPSRGPRQAHVGCELRLHSRRAWASMAAAVAAGWRDWASWGRGVGDGVRCACPGGRGSVVVGGGLHWLMWLRRMALVSVASCRGDDDHDRRACLVRPARTRRAGGEEGHGRGLRGGGAGCARSYRFCRSQLLRVSSVTAVST